MLVDICGERNPGSLLEGVSTGTAAIAESLEEPQKLKLGLPYDLAHQLLCGYLEDSESTYFRIAHTFLFPAATFTVAKKGTSSSAQQGRSR